MPLPTIIATGVAKPRAQGQLMDCTKQLREAMNNNTDEEDDL
jgi:hypothetical protein